MEKCDSCGEYKKVRKDLMGLNNFTSKFPAYAYDNICEECDKAKTIILKNRTREWEKDEPKRQKEWIKERNKLLSKSQQSEFAQDATGEEVKE